VARTARKMLGEYIGRGYTLDRIRILASGRQDPLRGQLLTLIGDEMAKRQAAGDVEKEERAAAAEMPWDEEPEAPVAAAPRESSGTDDLDLSQFDEDYASADAKPKGQFEDLPDGKYQVRVDEVELKETRETGKPMLSWKLVVINGEFEGRVLFRNNVITKKSIPFLKSDLELLGVTLERFSDLPSHLESLLDKQIAISKVTKDKYENLYFNTLLIGADKF